MVDKGIDYVLALNTTKFQSGLNLVSNKTKAASGALNNYWKATETGANRARDAVSGLATKVIGLVAAYAGLRAAKSMLSSVTDAAIESDKAAFNLGTSVAAANREFKVGSAESWSRTVETLTKELKIYSRTAISEAAAKTVDMTKRLGLSEQQMIKVIRAAANLSAGKFDLADGVERVTAALRGEAEASEALGLTLNENYIKGWYEARGATQGAWKDLTDLEKAQIRYQVLLEQSNPLMGKAAKSAGTYGGALTGLSGNYQTLKAALGETITRNAFFVDGIGKISEIIKGLSADVDKNRQKWMEWSKQGALAALDFAEAGLKATSSLYSGISAVSGAIKEAAAYYYELKAAYKEGAASGANWSLMGDKAEKFRAEAQAAAEKAEALKASAAQNFSDMEQGAPKILAAAEALRKFREELEKSEAKEIPLGDEQSKDALQQVKDDIIKIGDKFYNVAAVIAKANAATGKDVTAVWDKAFAEFNKSGSQNIDDLVRQLDAMAKDRTMTLTVKKVEANSIGGLIGGYKLGGMIQALANGGGVRNILGGGNLPGWGGGDRRLLLGEDGEVMLNKYAVRAGGIKAALAFNAGQFGVVISELMERTRSNIGYRLGGLMGSIPSVAPPMQALAAGGAVSGGESFGSFDFRFSDGSTGTVTTSRSTARKIHKDLEFIKKRASR